MACGAEGLPNKGMKLTRVGAGAERLCRGVAWYWIAAQLMPGVRPTSRRIAEDG